jgi:mannosyltransferase OCH1-like enzyme
MSITKNIIQISLYSHPTKITEKIKKYLDGWNYVFFKEDTIINYIEINPLSELINIKDNIILLKDSPYKLDFFKYYYLYINGGIFINSDTILEKDINSIINDNNKEQIYIQSCMDKMIFDGFIATIPKNKYILEILILMYDNLIIKKDSKINISEIKNIFCKKILNKNDYSTSIFYEIINENNCKIYDENKSHVLTHYYNSNLNDIKHLYYSVSYDKNFNKPKKDIKIGITFNIPKKALDLYCNGIRQNILYLTELLINIGYDCEFIIFEHDLKDIEENELKYILYDYRFKISKVSDIFKNNYDIVIIIGTILHTETIKLLKFMKTIILGYFCGNSYIIDSEAIIHGNNSGINLQYLLDDNEPLYDEIWSIPQMANMNLSYWNTFHRCKCIEVPFIWSPKGIEISQKIGNTDENYFLYSNRNKEKNIVICEPNISIMKWCLPCVLICENAYRIINNKNLLKHVYVTNLFSKDKFNIELFNKQIKNFEIFKEHKISREHRYNILNFLKSNADICVSHTWENGLNYLYLDLAWMGWPIIHNGHLCKDIGYYYDNFNYNLGGDILVNVIKNHDIQSKEYLEKNRKLIDRYLPTNIELQHSYEILITNLINSYKYNFNINTNIDYKYLITKNINPIIPLVIYQVWHSDDIPESVNHSIISIKQSNPEFDHKLFNLDMCRDFIKNNFEQRILDAFDNIIPYAFKFDLWRYCILYLNGGIYLDSKYYPLNNFKFFWLTDKEYFCKDLPSSRSGIYNALIICKPKNKLMFNAIYKLVENVENKYYGTFSLEPTGPFMLKQLAINMDININSFELELEKINDAEHYIRYNSLRILELHKEYRQEQKKYGKHWIYYWLNQCAYK